MATIEQQLLSNPDNELQNRPFETPVLFDEASFRELVSDDDLLAT
jgi:hypothetical protein